LAPPEKTLATILLVEDDDDMRRHLRDLLKDSYTVEAASDGKQALAAALKDPPGLLLADVVMPEMDGMALLRALRGDPSTQNIPVVLFSAQDGESVRIAAAEAGADDFLAKPFSGRELRARVEARLRISRVRHAALLAERNRFEDILRKSEADFRTFFELAAVGITQADPQTRRFVRVNRRFCEMVGYDIDELIGRPFTDLTHPDDVSMNLDAYGRTLGGEVSEMSFEKRLVRKDGSVFWALLTVSMVRDQQGKPLRLAAVVQDITESKQAQERLYELFMQAPLPICVLKGRELVFEMANPLYAKVAGRRDLLGKPFLEAIPELKGQGLDGVLLKVMETGTTYAGKEVPVRLDRFNDGVLEDTFWTFTYAPLRNPDGRVDRVIAFCSEVTDQVLSRRQMKADNDRLERRVAERTADLQSSNKELEAFSYSVAHDLRAPLRSITSFAQLILKDDGDKLGAASRERFDRIIASGVNMSLLIDGLLNLSRLTRQELKVARVDMNALCTAAAEEARRNHPGREVDFTCGCLGEVWGDEGLLKIVLVNLFDNAWKFTSHSPGARVEFGSAKGEDGRDVYFVRDNGAGFDMSFSGKLFGPFHRLHHVTEFPGTGIGLATVQRIIHRHGGRIWAEGAVGRGAAFYFTLGPPPHAGPAEIP
jgi:PAS domain S-box-containing protein